MTRADNASESSSEFKLNLSARNFEFLSSSFANLTQHCSNLDLPHTRRSSAAKHTPLPPCLGDNPVQLCFDSDAALVVLPFVLLFCFCCYCATTSSAHAKCKWQPHFRQPPLHPYPSPCATPFWLLVYCLRCSRQRRWQQAARRDCNSDCAGTAWQVASGESRSVLTRDVSALGRSCLAGVAAASRASQKQQKIIQ